MSRFKPRRTEIRCCQMAVNPQDADAATEDAKRRGFHVEFDRRTGDCMATPRERDRYAEAEGYQVVSVSERKRKR